MVLTETAKSFSIAGVFNQQIENSQKQYLVKIQNKSIEPEDQQRQKENWSFSKPSPLLPKLKINLSLKSTVPGEVKGEG